MDALYDIYFDIGDYYEGEELERQKRNCPGSIFIRTYEIFAKTPSNLQMVEGNCTRAYTKRPQANYRLIWTLVRPA